MERSWSQFLRLSRVWALLVLIGGGNVCIAARAAEEIPCDERKEKGQGMSGHTEGVRHKGPRMGLNFKTLDIDQNGYLSFEEFSKSERLSRMGEDKRRKLFDYLDRDKDGKLDMRELRPPAPHWMLTLRREFNALDLDQSGGLDYIEFSKAPHISEMKVTEIKRMFKRLDRNNDQVIKHSELKGRGPPSDRKRHSTMDLKKYDVDQSGGLNFDEYLTIPWVGRISEERRKLLFQKLDRNKDGQISKDEVRAAWEARRKHGGPPHGRHPRDKHQPQRGSRQSSDQSHEGSPKPAEVNSTELGK